MDETPKTTKRSRKRKRPHHSTDELEDLSPTARNSEATPTIHSRRGRSQSRTPTEESSEGGAATPDDPEPARKKKRKKKRDCDDSLPTPESDRDELKSSVKLDRFFGRRGEDVENWLFHVNAAAKFSRLPDRRKLAAAAMALSADARAEFRAFLGHDDVSDLTWRQFEVFLRKQFGPRDPTRHWTNKLMVCKQTARETVAKFASRFKQILLQHQNADPDAVSKTMTVSISFSGRTSSRIQGRMQTETTDIAQGGDHDCGNRRTNLESYSNRCSRRRLLRLAIRSPTSCVGAAGTIAPYEKRV